MFSALYDYKVSENNSKIISFKIDDQFLEVDSSKDPNWLHVVDQNGQIGYVPKNYVAAEQPSPQRILSVIDKFSENVERHARENNGYLSRNQYEGNKQLCELRKSWMAKIPPVPHSKKKPAPPPPMVHGSSEKDIENVDSEKSTSFIGRGVSLDREMQSSQTNGIIAQKEDKSARVDLRELCKAVPSGFSRKVAQKIRSETKCSFTTSLQAFDIVLESLVEAFPELNLLATTIISKGGEDLCEGLAASEDGGKLFEILEKLRHCKNDQQQRSWALHEDAAIIEDLLVQLLRLLTEGDQSVCRPIMQVDDSLPILTLVQYYQMETRWPLRNILLQIFGVICEASKANISFLSSSILPLELTREIIDEETPADQIGYIVLLLQMILSMADTLPSTHFSIMNVNFVQSLLAWIECYSKDAETDALADNLMALILAFNLQFSLTFFDDGRANEKTKKIGDNVVIAAIVGFKQPITHFFEKLLLLFNREEDPAVMFDFKPRPPNSVIRLMCDVYQCEHTAKLIYTNDEKVVVDIVLRSVLDLPVDDPKRAHYWTIFRGIVRHGKWHDHQHRRKDFEKVADNELLREMRLQ